MLLNTDGEGLLSEELFGDEDEGWFFDEELNDLFYLEELDLGLGEARWLEEYMASDNSAWFECEDWIKNLDHVSMSLLFEGSKYGSDTEEVERGTSSGSAVLV